MAKVRKASSIRLGDLKVDEKTRDLLEKRPESLDDLIVYGRNWYNFYEDRPSVYGWEKQLISAIKEADLIREELYPTTYCVAKLYVAITDRPNPFDDNEEYETMEVISDAKCKAILESMKRILKADQYLMVVNYFGFNEKEKANAFSLYACSKSMYMSTEKGTKLLKSALSRLANAARMYKLPAHFNLIQPEEGGEELTKKLGLGIRLYNQLKRAGFRTIDDILKYPADSWKKVITNINRKELVTKMHEIGYINFEIPEIQ